MRFLGFLVLSITMTTPSFAAEEPALPERQAGLWELKTAMDEGKGPVEQSMKMCIDAEMEKNTVKASIAEHKQNCTTYKIKSETSGPVVESDCMFNKRQVVSTTRMSGDFKSVFEVAIDSVTSDPEAKEKKIEVKRNIKQSGKYLSASCGDLKAGEAQGADGKRMLVQ